MLVCTVSQIITFGVFPTYRWPPCCSDDPRQLLYYRKDVEAIRISMWHHESSACATVAVFLVTNVPTFTCTINLFIEVILLTDIMSQFLAADADSHLLRHGFETVRTGLGMQVPAQLVSLTKDNARCRWSEDALIARLR